MKKIPPAHLLSTCKAIVTGGSSGGVEALREILKKLPDTFSIPILCVQHMHANDNDALVNHMNQYTQMETIAPCDKEIIRPGCVFMAPANYHMLVETEQTIALSIDDKVNWSRPSIDVLFNSAAYAWKSHLTAIILSGANKDGTNGITTIKSYGGLTIAQDPESASMPVMPSAAITTGNIDLILKPSAIADTLIEIEQAKRGITRQGE